MSKRILVEFQGDEKEIALMNEGKLLFYARESKTGVESEQIYLGKVDRIMKGMEAAFVQLGKDLNGFLPFSECAERPVSGQKILVQVKKPPIGDKLAYLTRQISIAGKYVILSPFTDRYQISRKIEAEDDRRRLSLIARSIMPAGQGIILRTESIGMDEAVLAEEVRMLSEKWSQILEACVSSEAPCLLQQREDALHRLLRDEHGKITEIVTNLPDLIPPTPLPVRYSENTFSLYNVRSKLQKSWQRRIWLDCGGFLVIDKTEALTVIDVNSGKYSGAKSGAESTFLKLNLEAAEEIARLLRLRNAGGIILIDFVDMEKPISREAVTEAFAEYLKDDPVKCVLHGFTSLGLMEMTRKKTDESLSPIPLCPHCHGTGLQEEP